MTWRVGAHPTIFLPNIESERLSAIDGEVLEKAAIVTPGNRPTKKTEKITNVSFPPEAIPAEKRRSVLREGKCSPGVEPNWKIGSARFSAFYKALVNKSDPGVRRDLCKVARSQVREQGGLARSREGLRVYYGHQYQARCS